MNSDSAATEAWGAEMEYVSFGDLWEFAGPDLLTYWIQRNLRIYNRIAALIESPSDRILVIYGNGHLGPLRQIIGADTRVRLRKLSDITVSTGRNWKAIVRLDIAAEVLDADSCE